ncbi:MAG: cation-translocating P-type ATPase, partial [Burkholderiaceae bacterium]
MPADESASAASAASTSAGPTSTSAAAASASAATSAVTDSPPWHALAAGAVVERLGSHPDGLTSAEAAERRARHGRNELPPPARPHPLRRFLAQFNNALIYFLIAGAVAAMLLGHRVDAAVILLVIVTNAIVGFLQEGKAERALDALRNLIAPRAHALRDGKRQAIDAAELVPGDVVLIEAGDQVPADLRLLRARGLRIDEAILTGESVAADKRDTPVAEAAALGDRTSMAFSGTLVAAGTGTGVVVATGRHSEIGRVGALLGSVEPLATPLLAQINQFARRFTLLAFVSAALLLVFAVLVREHDFAEALMVVVALAVGVVPEGLPAVITITLAIGVQRMAARDAIIRRLPAVETLGATSVICSDKTGTLTRNEMTVQRMVTAAHRFDVTGTGYAPVGDFVADPSGGVVAEAAALPQDTRELLLAGLLCNDAQLLQSDGQWRVSGDPMEGALLAAAAKAGLDAAALRGAWTRLDEIPFDAAHRFMATLNRAPDGRCVLFVKGAPEQVLALCGDGGEGGGGEGGGDGHGGSGGGRADDAHWTTAIDESAGRGQRVLGFALREFDTPVERIGFEDVRGLRLLGVAGFIDPPRDEAIAAVADCRSAGIRVKMITGDHARTAAAIATQLGLGEPRVITGAELDQVDDAALDALAAQTTVFARTSPEHKLRIVRALQRDGAIVAMTGDGVNDAPSLKQADVGIAMGRKGTEAAKQASAMVLADDNFASIVAAVSEGRTVYDNIRKVIAWTLPTNGGEVLAIIVGILAGVTLPMTPAQILWINMILTVTLGLVFAFEPAEPGVMQ